MKAIINYLDKIAHLIPVILCSIIILRILQRRKLEKKGYYSSLKREIVLGIYLTIIFALYSQTVFSDLDTFMLEGWNNINFEPLRFIIHSKTASESYFFINVLGNILFFVPIGLFTPMLFNGKPLLQSVGAGFLFSLSIEILQLPLLRATDVDDLILNTSGAFAGYILYIALSYIFPKIKTEFRIKK